MTEARRSIPQPKPVEPVPPPPGLSALFEPQPPSRLRVTQALAGGRRELAIVFKRTYMFDEMGRWRRADEQLPLAEEAVPHDELGRGIPPSFKALTEVVGFKTGTDVVIQGNACSPTPTEKMSV